MKSPIPPDEDKHLKAKKIGLVFLSLFGLIVLDLAFSGIGAIAPDYYTSERYDVSHNKENNYIILNPKAGVKHDSTLIFMHGYSGSSDSMFVGSHFLTALQGFAHGKIAPETTRIILPQAPVIYNPQGNLTTTSWFPFLNVTWSTETMNDRS